VARAFSVGKTLNLAENALNSLSDIKPCLIRSASFPISSRGAGAGLPPLAEAAADIAAISLLT
jgi:hypothetical protein